MKIEITPEFKEARRDLYNKEFQLLRNVLAPRDGYYPNFEKKADHHKRLAEDSSVGKNHYFAIAGDFYQNAAHLSIEEKDLRSAAYYFKKAAQCYKNSEFCPASYFSDNMRNYKILRYEAAKQILCERRLRKLTFGLLGRVKSGGSK